MSAFTQLHFLAESIDYNEEIPFTSMDANLEWVLFTDWHAFLQCLYFPLSPKLYLFSPTLLLPSLLADGLDL